MIGYLCYSMIKSYHFYSIDVNRLFKKILEKAKKNKKAQKQAADPQKDPRLFVSMINYARVCAYVFR